jgi:hypothetical protein
MYMYIHSMNVFMQCTWFNFIPNLGLIWYQSTKTDFRGQHRDVLRSDIPQHSSRKQILTQPDSEAWPRKQIFVANTEMYYGVIFLSTLQQGRMRMRAVPIQKMVIFFMQGQTLLRWRKPSASLSVAWSARSNLVLTDCILC